MISIKKRNFILLLVVAVVVGAVFSGGMLAGYGLLTDQRVISKEKYEEATKIRDTYGKLFELQEMIENQYYVEADTDALLNGAYKGLFAGLEDPYSQYLTAEEYEDLMVSTTGEYQGIGVTITPDEDGYINVVAPIDGTPAAEAGIKAGDKIVKVDGKTYNGETIDAAVSAMRGEAGTEVVITVLRNGKTTDFTIKRKNIVLETVKTEMLEGNIAYLRLSSFESHTSEDFRKAIRDLEVKGVSGMIIDLRDNPGGLVDSSVEVADQLLPAGVVTYTEDHNGEKEYYKSAAGETKLPYVLLVNKGTASAAEILTAAVQDNDGGKVVGTTTYGKGIIQAIYPMEDGSGDAVKLTVMQYFSPDGNVIHKVGVKPDVEVELADGVEYGDSLPHEKDDQLQEALKLLK